MSPAGHGHKYQDTTNEMIVELFLCMPVNYLRFWSRPSAALIFSWRQRVDIQEKPVGDHEKRRRYVSK